MDFKRLLIAAVVLAGLGGAVWWSNKSEAAKEGKPDPKAPPKVLEIKDSDIKKIEIKHSDGEDMILAKDDSGKWSITTPKSLAADQSSVSSITNAVGSMSS